ncbi:MAG TPA: AAA family ATPase, partial [Bryobacteraceae bacterium]|nr:AAA family ATPase [Bryobacteraceae bacterium]
MLTRLQARNFKRFDFIDVELGNPVVFVGPNNSGKTTALQALALWDLGVRRWHEKRGETETPAKRPGVVINRRDFFAAAIPEANLLWRDLHVRDVRKDNGKQSTTNIRIDVSVWGVANGKEWQCGLEFDYANAESFHCRPLRLADGKDPDRLPVPAEAKDVRVAFLPPMSGLADREFAKQPGEVGFLIGQGRTAEVLRNLCNQVYGIDGSEEWEQVRSQIMKLFGIQLNDPELRARNAEIVMSYRERGVDLDLSCAGRGVQQTLLLLTYMAANPGAVLLLDEPDAHLEILRQREVYELVSNEAVTRNSQIVIASHSEVILNEAADRDVVIAFVGAPHRIDDRGSQVLKSLKEIGFEHYYQAEQRGWVLYVEGSNDLEILRGFARLLGHPAAAPLEAPFVQYIGNQAPKARDHFYGLREAKPDLSGFLLCDRLEKPLQENN